jgi:hypothetical protein
MFNTVLSRDHFFPPKKARAAHITFSDLVQATVAWGPMQTWHSVGTRNSPPECERRKAFLIHFELLTRLCTLVLGLIQSLARSAWTPFLFSHGIPPVSKLKSEVMKPLQLDQLRCMIIVSLHKDRAKFDY